jgi:hypothetical protein
MLTEILDAIRSEHYEDGMQLNEFLPCMLSVSFSLFSQSFFILGGSQHQTSKVWNLFRFMYISPLPNERSNACILTYVYLDSVACIHCCSVYKNKQSVSDWKDPVTSKKNSEA